MASIAAISSRAGPLTVTDNAAGHGRVIGRDSAGNILVSGGSMKLAGAKPAIADTTETAAFGLDGNDNNSVNETNGPMPSAHMLGGMATTTTPSPAATAMTSPTMRAPKTVRPRALQEIRLRTILSPQRRYRQEVLRER